MVPPQPLWAPWRARYVQAPKGGQCVFCRAAEGDDPLLVLRGSGVSAILNAFPYAPGHLMLFPHRHLPAPGDLNQLEQAELWSLLCRCLDGMREVMKPAGFNVGLNLGRVAGAGIPGHLHLHVVPRWEGDHNFMPVLAETTVISQALEETAAALRAALSSPSRQGEP